MINEELQQKANQVLLSLLEGVETVGGKAMDEVPLLLGEIVTYGLISGGVKIALSCLFVVFGLKSINPFLKFAKEADDTEFADFAKTLGLGIFIFISLAIGSLVITSNIEPTLKAGFAPRLYLIDFARSIN